MNDELETMWPDRGSIPAFAWNDRKAMKNLRIVGVLPEI